MLPDLESLRCFEAAARRLGFAAAAREVRLSPPAFSERIRRLEEQLGTALFQRSVRRVTLTPAGSRLLPHARQLLEAAERCAPLAREDAEAPPFELTLGTRFEVGLSWLVPLLPRLASRRPERMLHLRFGDSPDLLRHVREGNVDAVVTSARISSTDFEHVVLQEERFAFVAAPELIRKRPLRKRADAARHVLLDAHAELPLFRYFLDAHPAREVWPFQRIERLGTIAAIRHRALAGNGVAVLPEFFVRRDLLRGALVRLFRGVRLQTDFFRLVWARGHVREPELRALAGELREVTIR